MPGSEDAAGSTEGATGRTDGRPVFEVHDLRRREVEAFAALAASNIGELEVRLGLGERADRQLRSLTSGGLGWFLRLLGAFGRSPVRLLVAVDASGPVGTTIVVRLGPWAYVAAVGVRTDRRGQGIAQALVRRAETIAGRRRLVLEVDAENEPARRLYAKLGWVRGPSIRWWELPASTGPVGGRPARRADIRAAHDVAARTLGYGLPRGYVHPCELVSRATGGSTATFATGPVGVPGLVVRACAGAAGEPAFLLAALPGDASREEQDRTLRTARAWVTGRGAVRQLLPVPTDQPTHEAIARRAGGTPMATSEVWSKVPSPA